ncbi:MAG: hypothetical protein AAB602_02670 [Patescibacteria group bacterium]
MNENTETERQDQDEEFPPPLKIALLGGSALWIGTIAVIAAIFYIADVWRLGSGIIALIALIAAIVLGALFATRRFVNFLNTYDRDRK